MNNLDLTQLNQFQVKPVTDTDGQLLVVAGAGSGKTRVLTYRVAYLINHIGVDPHNILAITFTNKAAKEMETRINTMLGGDNPVWVSTFHSMANRILRYDIDKIGYDRNFSIYAEPDVDRVIKRILQNKHIDDKETKFAGKVRWHISNAKNLGMDSDKYAANMAFSRNEEHVIDVFKAYEEELKANNALDFDDLLLKTVELFLACPDVLVKYSKRFKYIHIDEFQDTNKVQYQLLRMLASYHMNIFVVGDDDQSIYGFRGADVSNILNFKKDFPEAKIYKLERNYRSTDNILAAANSVIVNNKKRISKKLWTEAGTGEPVVIKENSSDRDEAEYVISKISGFLKEGYALKDMAILIRQNSLTRLFEEKLNLYGYAYKLFGGFRFYERKEIKDIVSYMKMISNPKDGEAILRIINFPKRGIGDILMNRVADCARARGTDIIDVILNIENDDAFSGVQKTRLTEFKNIVVKLMDASLNLPLYDYVEAIVRTAGFEAYYKTAEKEEAERYENIIEFVNAVREFCKDNPGASAEEFLQSVALISDIEDPEDDDRIILATIHSVKGLEFKIVFIACLEEKIFPSAMSINEDSEAQEERRVMYVAITRAREKLVITYAKSRFRFKEVIYSLPSRFVKEMEGCPNIVLQKLAEPKYSAYGDYKDYGNTGSSFTDGGAGYKRGKLSGSDFLNPDRAAIERMLTAGEGSPQPYKAYSAQGASNGAQNTEYEKYKPGAKVFHKKFGEGTIVAVSGYGSEMSASIAFAGLGVKKFNVSLAPLKIVEK
ncbi:MAG: UvrD-helicase domain-containing protein [Clostridiales bacterium]|jgi:DNA helicase-2/ATP-dependent DNA helicase PcrA|nr:UvrD-helicase domain-containing protein [Clostridiales bacterium]